MGLMSNLMLALCLALVILSAPARGARLPDPYSRVHYCGWRLSTMLSMICQANGYNRPNWAETEGARVRRSSGEGIVAECCRGGCTWSDLASYCAGGDSIDLSRIKFPEYDDIRDDKSHVVADRSAEASNSEAASLEVLHPGPRARVTHEVQKRSAAVVGWVRTDLRAPPVHPLFRRKPLPALQY